MKAPEVIGDLVLDRAIRRLLALRRDAAPPAVQRAADDALSGILSLKTGIEDDSSDVI